MVEYCREFQNFIIEQVNMLDILKYYKITYGGGKYTCPFHTDETPSLQFFGNDGLAFCFSCAKMYDPLEFIKNYEKCTTDMAKHILKFRFGVDFSKFNLLNILLENSFDAVKVHDYKEEIYRLKYKVPLKVYLSLWQLYDSESDKLPKFIINVREKYIK